MLSDVLKPLAFADPWVLQDTSALTVLLDSDPDLLFVTEYDLLFTVDVDALYPSMDIALTVSIVHSRLSAAFPDNPDLVHALTELLQVVLDTSFVECNGTIYRQLRGIAMGIACCTHLANMFVSHIFRPVFARWREHIRFARGYIDDIVGVWRGPHHLFPEFIHDLNHAQQGVHVTYATSTTSINFLDLTIYKGPRLAGLGLLDYRPYAKPLNRWLYIPFSSAHAPRSLPGFIRGEAIRLLRISSQDRDAVTAVNIFATHLLARGYPLSVIKRQLRSVQLSDRQALRERTRGTDTDSARSVFLPLQFTPTAAAALPLSAMREQLAPALPPGTRLLASWTNAPDLLRSLRLQWPSTPTQ